MRRQFGLPATILPTTVALALLVGGCSDTPTDEGFDENERGALLGTQLLETVSEARIATFGLPIDVGSAVELHRLTYRTVDPHGELTTASAMLAVPVRRSGPLPLLSYQHTTIVRKDAVASVQGTEDFEALVAIAFATDGYVAVMPDYLGLGSSPGLHPYLHASSLATAVVDAIRAVRQYSRRQNIDLEDRIFLAGYSEGGYATAAAQRLIESSHADEFTITASAPMALPFDLAGSMIGIMASDEPYAAPYFVPYALVAYNDVYGLADGLTGILKAPYDTTIPPMFDGLHSGAEINESLPSVPRDELTDGFLQSVLSDPDFVWNVRLRENGLLDWSPTSRTRIYHCVDDDYVDFANAEEAIQAFRDRGVPETVVDLSSGAFGGDVECAPVFLLLAKFWMDEILTGAVAKDIPTIEQLRSTTWRPVR